MTKIPKFDERGCLPKGYYEPPIEEFISRFVNVMDITIRSNLFEKYKEYSQRCLNTKALIKHYINGSYVTNKENPGDIDLLGVFDGDIIDNSSDEIYEEQRILVYEREKMKEKYSIHVWGVSEYPKELDVLNKHNDDIKKEVLSWWETHYLDKERKIKDPKEKGVVILHENELQKIEGIR